METFVSALIPPKRTWTAASASAGGTESHGRESASPFGLGRSTVEGCERCTTTPAAAGDVLSILLYGTDMLRARPGVSARCGYRHHARGVGSGDAPSCVKYHA